MKSLIALSIIFTCILFFSSCDDYKPECCTCETPYSETGAGTMGCLMDGQPWAICNAAHEKISPSATGTVFNFQPLGYRIDIQANKFFNGGDEAMYIFIWNPKIGKLSPKTPQDFYVKTEFFTLIPGSRHGFFKSDTSNYAEMEITRFDTINRIISGRFECTLKRDLSETDSTKIKVTKGFFDTKF